VAYNGYADAMGDAYHRLAGLGYERGDGMDLANHGPMGAEALAVMGFGDEVAAWVEDYKRAVSHHAPPEPRFGLDPADEQSWREGLGQFDRVGDWEQLFARELMETPWRDVLNQWWPRLLAGVMAGLTHGLIRTAHAARCLAAADSPQELALDELARGLAYWAARYAVLPGDVAFTGQRTVAEAIVDLSGDFGEEPNPGARRAGLGQNSSYRGALTQLSPQGDRRLLSEMTSAFAGVYLGHPEAPPVPLIHGVTAPAALRMMLPHLAEEHHVPATAAIWRIQVALLFMFARSGGGEHDRLKDAANVDKLSWRDLFGRALVHGDEHIIKFTEACYRENVIQPDPRFAAAVGAALQRIPARALGGGAATVIRR
jgi:Questin oxidase-like